MTRAVVLARLAAAQRAADRIVHRRHKDADVDALARAVLSLTEIVAVLLEAQEIPA